MTAATRRSMLCATAATGAATAVLGLGAAACTGAPSSAPKSLQLWGGPHADQRRDQVSAWNAAHPGAQVQFHAVPAVGQGTQALRAFAAAAAAKTGPDLVDVDRFQVATFANWRAFRPLDQLVSRDKVDLTRFLPATLDESTGLDRRLYALPNSVDNRLLFWNKEAFAAAGLDPERPPATWAELQDYAARLTSGGGHTAAAPERLGFHTQEGQASLHLFAWQNGGGFLSEDGKTARLAHPANEEALQWLADVMRHQTAWPAATAARERWGTGSRHPFLTGELAMQYQLPNWAGEVLARHRPDLPFGVAPPPLRRLGDRPLTWSGGYSYVLNRDARQQDAAWAMARWLVGDEAVTVAAEGERRRAREAGGVSMPGMTGQPLLDAGLLQRYRTGIAAVDGVLEVALGMMAHTRVRERCIAAADLWDAVAGAQLDAVSQRQSPAQALAGQEAGVQRALDQAWLFAPKS